MASIEITINGRGFFEDFGPWFDGHESDYDMDNILVEFNECLTNSEPEGITWGWNEEGPWCFATEEGYLRFGRDYKIAREFDHAVGRCDLIGIVERNRLK